MAWKPEHSRAQKYYETHLKGNPEYIERKAAYNKEYRLKNKDIMKKKAAIYAKKNGARLKLKWNRDVLKFRYGITPEQYDKILSMQGGVCAICGELRLASNQKRMGVDHCHDTNKVRGILCNWCNQAVGYLGNAEILIRAIQYLKTNGDHLDIGEILDTTKYSLGTRNMKYLKKGKQKQDDNSQTQIVSVARVV